MNQSDEMQILMQILNRMKSIENKLDALMQRSTSDDGENMENQ